MTPILATALLGVLCAVTAWPAAAQAASVQNGVRHNGVKYNGVRFNGVKFNGLHLNAAAAEATRLPAPQALVLPSGVVLATE